MFAPAVTRFWLPGGLDDAPPSAEVRVVVDPGLPASRAVSVLRVSGGPTMLTLTPEWARTLSLSESSHLDPDQLGGRLAVAGVDLNDPDHLFYLPQDRRADLGQSAAVGESWALTAADAEAFTRFTDAAPAADLDEAFVELDHWLVVGTFLDGDLAAVASAYPWAGTVLADMGVVTLPDVRGRGLGRATIRAISAAAIEQGHEPQYRCQITNTASVALARSAGFAHFGEWEVIDAEP